MGRKVWFYIIFFTVLVMVFFVTITWLIPDFTKPRLPRTSVQPFSFTNQDGIKITNKDVAGKVYVAEYFFTTCRGICPRMNKNMRKVYEKFRNEDDFLILSHTCDPEIDSAARLKQFADSMGVSTSRWIFLTGRKDSLYTMARLSYNIDDPANNLKDIDDDFLHTQFFALVDKEGKVHKVYDGIKESEVEAMINDIEKLLN